MTTIATIRQFQIREAATKLFHRKGFEQVTMSEIALEAKLEEQDLYTYFGSKYDIVLQLYLCINADWQLAVGDITTTKLHERFEEAMLVKLEMMDPFCDALAGMMGHLLRSEKVGIGSGRTAHIRQMGLTTIRQVIEGASDGKMLRKKVKSLPAAMYLIHWTLLLLHVQGGDMEGSRRSVAMASKMLKKAKDASFFFPIFPFVKDLGTWAQQFVGDPIQDTRTISEAILRQVFHHRKLIDSHRGCVNGSCNTCLAIHLPKVEPCVAMGIPLHFVLPAFPAKSPNRQKTLGVLPDLGEEIALQTLQSLCNEIKTIYPPGAKITICSDGRIFSSLVGVDDQEITQYVAQLRLFIAQEKLVSLEVLNLEDLMPDLPLEDARQKVLADFAEPLDNLRASIKTHDEMLRLFNGIHRFIFEDRLVSHPEQSVNKTKVESKTIALQVIQHSNAWTRFLVQMYPEALRLSIHPYSAHSEKIGIRLTKANDDWLTPWHGAIVLGQDGYVLMKATQAIALGARIVLREGKPNHFTLAPQ